MKQDTKTKEVLDNLFNDRFLRLPKYAIRLFGVDAALMLGELYSEYCYWRDHKELQSNKSFYSTVENIQNEVGLTAFQQRNAIKTLEDYGIIKVSIHGMPKRRFFNFNYNCLSKLLNDFNVEREKDKERIEEHRKNYEDYQCYEQELLRADEDGVVVLDETMLGKSKDENVKTRIVF